jgi:hypothetical protein
MALPFTVTDEADLTNRVFIRVFDRQVLQAGSGERIPQSGSALSSAPLPPPAAFAPIHPPPPSTGPYRESVSRAGGASRSFSVWFLPCEAIPGERCALALGRAGRLSPVES